MTRRADQAGTRGAQGRLKATHEQDFGVYQLPGRDWLLCIGPQNSDAENLTVGMSIFPAGSAPEGHVHDVQEEVIYILSGEGQLVTTDGTVELTPGTTVYIPVGLHHATVSRGPQPLRLISIFSPPVVPGSYESPR